MIGIRKPKTLTELGVKRIKLPTSGRAEHWDAALPGFGMRVSASGTKTWFLMTRVRGKQRRFKIGRYPQFDLKSARDVARDYLARIAKGQDPDAHRTQEKVTFGDVAAEYIKRECPRLARGDEFARIIDRDLLSRWADRPFDAITRRDIVQAVDAVMDRGTPYAAITLQQIIKRIFNWSISRGYVDSSPAANMESPAEAISRDRVLTDDEIRRLWSVWEDLRLPFGPFMKVLLLTGQRRSEVASMRWSDVDFDSKVWTLPREFTKADRLHEVPLSPLAMEILEAVPRMGDYVFTTTGDRPISGFSKAKQRTVKLSEVNDWRLHDLRRTAASGMARLGIAPHVVEKVLNHASGTISGVAAIYNRHGYTEEKRNALNTWARALDAVIRPSEDNVIDLRGSG